MIYDKIDNLETYVGISDDIRLGLDFLKQVKPDTAVGTYQINHRVKAIISEYDTKIENEKGYEAHNKCIDIQYLLTGFERIACLPIDKLTETKPYTEEKDVAFYKANTRPLEMTIGDGFFAIFFPQDGHMPQLCVDKPTKVKKVVIKVKI